MTNETATIKTTPEGTKFLSARHREINTPEKWRTAFSERYDGLPTEVAMAFATRDFNKAQGEEDLTKVRDQLTFELTAFDSFDEMLNARGGYRPSMDVSIDRFRELANHYDQAQEARGDGRRAFRYGNR